MRKDAKKTYKNLESAYQEGDLIWIGELWKRRSAIGRLHNIVRYIKASPQHRQFFRSIEIGSKLAVFNGLETDLARMALDVLAVPPMSDECKHLFSSAKLLLTDCRLRLRMDIIEASECLRAWYGRPERKAFDNSSIGLMEDEARDEAETSGLGAEGKEDSGGDDGSEESNILENTTGAHNGLRI
ncbi:hypothetical protein AUP68_09231 [Ilyonectria robusta]